MRKAFCFGVFIVATIVAGCGSANDHAEPASKEAGASKLKQLRFAVFPGDDGQAVDAAFEPLRSKLEQDTGIPVKLIKASDYSGVIEAMRTRKVELGQFGPLSYTLAKREAGAEAFAAAVGKTGNGTYHSIMLVRSDSPYQSIKDLKGKKIALVDPASASGSLLPHMLTLRETGTELEQYFSKVDYAGTHPAAIRELVNKTVDVAGVEEKLDQLMAEAGQIPKGSVREILRSEELPPSPWAYRKDLDEDLKKKIRDAFLSMKPVKRAKALAQADHYRLVEDKEFDIIAELVDKLKVSRDAMLKK